ncbi:MAG: TetR/AcrR family transcriptional regulator [Clostridia bacterium]|nr:TetR/AcrR family transcriptional regulator [Clostridia bacterium]MBQ7718377.1 TetR/AcrR family transcriptional regulator [Clostridia bacterium]
MPPKVKFTSNEIIEAAVKITRTKGIAAVTAREVGATLGVSSRPLFTYFDTVEELKREVYLYAKNLYKEYVENGLKAEKPFLGVGQQYLRFAKEEPNLYKYLFLTPPDGVRGGVMEGLKLSQDLARESLMRIYNMDADTADKYFRDLWLVAYGFTTMIAIGECPYTDEQISAIFTEFSLSICKAYKEIPGLPDGKFDKNAIFKELVKKEKNNDIND